MKAESFGYKNAWIAVKTERPEAVAEALGLRDVRPADWKTGIDTAYEYPTTCAVYVTPAIEGWVLAVGHPVFSLADTKPPSFGRRAAEVAASLGTDVCYFATHRVVEAHAWALARPGGLARAYYWVGESGETVHDEGAVTADEREIEIAFTFPSDDTDVDDPHRTMPCEEHVMALAAKWSIDPSSLGDRNLDVADGLLGDFGEPRPPAPPPLPPASAKPWWKLW